MAQSSRTHAQVKSPLAGQIAAIKAGQHRFQEGCAGCHGANAEGGRGPDLADNRTIKRMNAAKLFDTIRHGVPGTEMPPSSMPDENIWEVAAFIRSLNTAAFETPVEGDLGRGRAVFFGSGGCSNCHMIRGRGGFLGPDLTNIGFSSSIAQLRENILHPSNKRGGGFRSVTVVLKNDTRIEGIAKDNSNYSIQILDTHGHLHLLNKARLKEVVFAPKSPMPDTYGETLSPQDLQNLVAFLSRQVIRPQTERTAERSRREAN
ncbi:MAG TPA: c-type cytochrome [Bryobacteraceae bacterium]